MSLSRGNLILIYSHVSNKLVFAVVTSARRLRRSRTSSYSVPGPQLLVFGPQSSVHALGFCHLFFAHPRNFRHSTLPSYYAGPDIKHFEIIGIFNPQILGERVSEFIYPNKGFLWLTFASLGKYLAVLIDGRVDRGRVCLVWATGSKREERRREGKSRLKVIGN